VGRPLYPQLSGPCNRPFPRDSRVFTRRLTPNLVCSRSHRESTTRSQENNHKTRRLQNNYTRSHGALRSQDNTLYRSIQGIHKLHKGAYKNTHSTHQLYDGIRMHQSSKGVHKYKQRWHTPSYKGVYG